MRRYWISSSAISGQRVLLEGDVFHHICHVCRIQTGDRFELIAEGGLAYLVEVTEVNKKNATAQVMEKRAIAPLRRPYIHLQLAITRFQTMDVILEKMVELGVKSVTPLFTDFSFLRSYDAAVFGKKMSRWEKIILGATQQCGRGELMELHKPLKLDDVLTQFRTTRALGLFAYEGPDALPIKPFLSSQRGAEISDIHLFIGSEGGFSFEEVKAFAAAGLQPVTLGEQVLRVETACVALASILKYEFGLMCNEAEVSQ